MKKMKFSLIFLLGNAISIGISFCSNANVFFKEKMGYRKVVVGLIFMLIVMHVEVFSAGTLTKITGGASITVDNAKNATSPLFTTMGNFTYTEGANSDIPAISGMTMTLTAPTGWEFNTSGVSIASSSISTLGTLSVTSSAITISGFGDAINAKHNIVISGVQIRLIDGANQNATGDILITVIGGTMNAISSGTTTANASTLSNVVGAQTKLVVKLPGQTFTDAATLAGSGITGTPSSQCQNTSFNISSLTATDQFYNIITAYTGSKTITYSGPTGSPSYTSTVAFTNGVSTTALTTILTVAETTNITTKEGALYGSSSSSFTVNTTPTAVTVANPGTYCNSTTLTASGGSGGTIYWQNTTSNGTSTTTASASQVVSANGTYYFRSQSASGCWGTQGSAAVIISSATAITNNPSDATVSSGGNTSFTVIASNSPTGYTWEVSTDGGTIWNTITNGGVYTNATTATLNITSATLGMTGYKFRAKAINVCGTSAASAAAALTVSLCVPSGSTSYYLTNVKTTGGNTNFDNTTTTSTNGYGDYHSTTSCSVSPGSTINISLTSSAGDDYFYIWIDLNNDGDFNDAGETIAATTSYAVNYSIAYVVSSSQPTGSYLMRVANSWSGAITSCGTASYGEYEDYTINVTAATPMVFSSCTTTQTNVASVAPGATSQEIIGMQIVTTGVTSPLTASSFTFDITGSSAAGNIANAKLWTSGTTSTFTSLTQLGGTVTSPTGAFTINTGTGFPYTLSSGTNYFWLTYDIVASPTLGNVVDAECTSINVTSARTPTVSAPSGSRTIVLSYCSPAPTSVDGDGITNVTCGTINNTTGTETDNYGDYSALSTTIQQGESATVNITYSTGYTYDTKIWVDWNIDGDFDDAGEDVFTGASQNTNPTTLGTSFTVPVGTSLGNHRMRIGGQDNGPCTPCYDGSYGSYEDYTITVTAAAAMIYVSCTATQANTNVISTSTSNQEIICMKVVTSGSLNPLSATEFRMRTDGTTAYSTDIRNAKIWYTGNSATFAASNQFGATVATPPTSGTDMVFTGTQELVANTNYFWMTYDVPAAAVNGNFADAKFQSVVVAAATQTPTMPTPPEKREIIRGCFYTLTLKDDASDGWNGGKITVRVNGVDRLTNETLASGSSATFQFIAESGQTITTEYTAGSYPSENSYLITNPNGAYVFSSGEAQTPPVNKSATADCNAVKQFTTNVDTYQSGTSCFIITEDKTGQKGSIWSNYKIDMTESFSIEFDLYLGDDNGGADGVVFALQGSCTSAGGNGMSIGYGGIDNSIGVEFDSYDNGDNSDLSSDHFAIISNGYADHGLSSNLRGPSAVADIEDNAWHPVKIIWNATTKKFSVSYGTLTTDTLSYTGDIVNTLFAGNSQVFWGFTGATGALSNLQKVCITSYPQNTTQVADTTINAGVSVAVQVAIGAASYTWIPDDGSVSNTAIANPVLSPVVTTEYTCLLEDGCGKIITNKFTVRVNSTLPVELLDFSTNCQSTGVELSWSTASESNNDYFILEKSTDLITYQQIAIINGVGNSTTVNNYSYLDKQNKGMGYYRLTQVDYDGNKSVFKPIAADCYISERLKALIIYPNPATEWFSLELPTDVKAKVQILNMMGMVVSEIDEITSASKMDIRNLAKGVYMVISRVGNEIYYCKLNKH